MSVIQHRSGVQREVRRSEKRLDLKSCPSLRRSTGGKFAHVNDAERRGHPFRGLETLASATFEAGQARARGCFMIPVVKARLLEGKRGLVVGIANDQSIAWGCAKAFRAFGAELAVTYLNDKAKKYVEPLARELEAPILMPLEDRKSTRLN